MSATGPPAPADPFTAEFFKMSAGGNDFILFDNRSGALRTEDLPARVRALCARGTSVGADGVILLETSARADVRAAFFNPDGRPTFCGNGARCAARLAYLRGMAPARLRLESDVMIHRAEIGGTRVSLEMRDIRDLQENVEVACEGEVIRGTFMDTGVPHYVVFRDVPPSQPIDPLGRALRRHPRFAPAGTNVDFIQAHPGGPLSIRTYERGVEGETLACGTGCVAAAVAAAIAGRARSPVTLRARSGAVLGVRFEGDPRRPTGVRLEGEARLVYVGHLTEEAAPAAAPRAASAS
jgi:diaminopimelate epimerase